MRVGDLDPVALAAAREEILIAEGSDWFWWYGDDHSSDQDLEFDDLFRRHLRNVYGLLGKPVPDELFVSNISGLGAPPAQTAPTALVTPTVDGEETSYFEWLGAGALEIREDGHRGGAMHQATRRSPMLRLVQFGFGRSPVDKSVRLNVRLDCDRPLVDLLADGYAFALKFLQPAGVRFVMRMEGGKAIGTFWDRGAAGDGRTHAWTERGPGAAVVAAGAILEAALPLDELAPSAVTPVTFFVVVLAPDRSEIEVHPEHHPIEVAVPDDQFEARNWTA